MNNLTTTALSLGRLAMCANTLESWPTLVQENVSPLAILLPPYIRQLLKNIAFAFVAVFIRR